MTRARRSLVGFAIAAVGLAIAAVGTAPARQLDGSDPADAPPVTFRHLTTEDGLANGSVLAIAQDALGFLWVGTADGLTRYDGATMRAFRQEETAEGLGSSVVQALAAGDGGAMWVGTAAGLDRYDPATERFVRVEGLPASEVLALHADGEGGAWVGTTGGAARVSPEGEVTASYGAGASAGAAVAAFAETDGALWLGTDQGLARLDPGAGRIEPVRADTLAQLNVSSLAPSATGDLLVGTLGAGLLRYRPGAGFSRVELAGGVLGDIVAAVYEDADASIWVGTIGAGLLRIRPGGAAPDVFVHRDDNPASLADDQVSALMEDRQGLLWVGTYDGLDRFDRSRGAVTRLRHDPQDRATLASDDVNAILAGSGGTLYIGTDVSVDRTTDGERFEHTRITTSGTAIAHGATALLEDRAGVVWVGTDGYGLHRLDGDELVKRAGVMGATQGNRRNEASITTLLEGRDGRLWIGTVSDGLVLYDRADDRAVHYRAADGLASDHVESLAEDARGTVWVGTVAGLCRVDAAAGAGAFTCFAPGEGERGLRGGTVQALWSGDDGALWAGTREGLHRLDTRDVDAGFTFIGPDEGLPGANVLGLIEDADGMLWASTNGGLAQVEPVTRTVSKRIAPRAGATLGGALARDAEGRILVGGTAGLLAFDPDQLASLNPNPPQVVLTNVEVDGEPVVPGPDAELEAAAPVADRLQLGPDASVVTFEYAGLHFSEPAQNRYRYRLDGFDDDWREAGDAGARREVTYTNLDAGRYTFEVEASNADGVWSEAAASLDVVVRPPWWRTLWAYLAFGALAAVGLWRADAWQRARLLREERDRAERREAELRAATAEAERRKVEAEADVLKAEAERQSAELERAREAQEANAKLAAANTRLESSLSDLQAAQAQLVQAEKLASLGQLTAGIAHEIKNPLNFVNNFADLSVDLAAELTDELHGNPDQPVSALLGELDPILEDLRENARRIHEHGQRADRIVRAMLLHSRGGSDEKARVNLNAFVEEYANLAYHGAKANDADFQVTLDRQLDAEAGEAEVVPQEMGRVLINLLTNAFYAVQKRSRDRTSDPRVTVRTRREDATVVVEIEDNGTGMTEETQRRIFEPFFTTKPTGQGTGLGLSLAHDIVVGVHGGDLMVTSAPGEGTTFTITLPGAG